MDVECRVNDNLNKQVFFILLPANFLMGILAIMGPALAGSDRPGHLPHISHDNGWVDCINPDLLVKKKAHNIITTAIALYW